jgi:hypothetical protein
VPTDYGGGDPFDEESWWYHPSTGRLLPTKWKGEDVLPRHRFTVMAHPEAFEATPKDLRDLNDPGNGEDRVFNRLYNRGWARATTRYGMVMKPQGRKAIERVQDFVADLHKRQPFQEMHLEHPNGQHLSMPVRQFLMADPESLEAEHRSLGGKAAY